MDNLFQFVQALTIAHDASVGLQTINHDDVVDADCVDPEQVSKCYKDSSFTGFKCDDCDCKEWN